MRPLPRSLTGQVATAVFAAFIAAQIISLWLFTDERGRALQAALRHETAGRSAAMVLALEAAPPANRDAILQAARTAQTDFTLAPEALVAATAPNAPIGGSLQGILDAGRPVRAEEIAISPHSGLPADPPALLVWLKQRMMAAGRAPVELRLSLQLSDGGWLNVRARDTRPSFQLPPVMLATILFSLVLVMAALWLGLRRITGPLRNLAAAAEDFGIDSHSPAISRPPIPRNAPAEVQALSDALGRMQARVSGMTAERTRMLAALGHDLRSPLTALRLRAELVEEDENRDRMIAILDEMRDMIEATLAYARGLSTDQPTEAVDLARLIAELSAELAETGAPITFVAADPAELALRRMPIRRALRNLVENAQRYGGPVEIRLHKTAAGVEILIDDRGPGIPEADLERVFDPYLRLETSRSRDTGGVGLGLPIARAILRAHAGDVRLSRRPEGGLRARVWLPAR